MAVAVCAQVNKMVFGGLVRDKLVRPCMELVFWAHKWRHSSKAVGVLWPALTWRTETPRWGPITVKCSYGVSYAEVGNGRQNCQDSRGNKEFMAACTTVSATISSSVRSIRATMDVSAGCRLSRDSRVAEEIRCSSQAEDFNE